MTGRGNLVKVRAARLVLNSRAVERAVPWLAALAVAAPVLLGRYPPMVDLPCHEEIVAAERYFGDASRYPAGLLTWNLGYTNQLFYLLAGGLALLLPVSAACKALVAASVAGVPLAAAHLANYLGKSRWVAVAVAPLGLGFFFYWGLVGNLLSLGLLIASLPLLDRFVRKPSATGVLAATLTLLVLYYAHDSALAIACIAIVVLSLGRPLVPAATAWRVTPLVIGVAVAGVEEVYAMGHMGANLRSLPLFIDLAPWQKMDQVPQALLGYHGATTTRPAFLFVAASMAVLGAGRVVRGRAPVTGIRAWLDAHRFELLGVSLVVAYFEVPFCFSGSMWLHARFLSPGVAVLLIALAPRLPSRLPMPARAASVLAVAATLALVGRETVATGAIYSDLDPLLARIAPGSAVAPLDMVGGRPLGLVFTVACAAARASTERGGRMAASFTQSTPIPSVIIAPEHRWENSFSRMAGDTLLLEPAFDLRRFQYVLAWAFQDQQDDVMRALVPEARLVARSGGWLLFESTLAVESLVSVEPTPGREESVRERLDALARARHEFVRKP